MCLGLLLHALLLLCPSAAPPAWALVPGNKARLWLVCTRRTLALSFPGMEVYKEVGRPSPTMLGWRHDPDLAKPAVVGLLYGWRRALHKVGADISCRHPAGLRPGSFPSAEVVPPATSTCRSMRSMG